MAKFGSSLSERLARFEQKMDTTDHVDGSYPSKPRPLGKFRGFQPSPIEKCHACDKRVYIQEKITADNLDYHKFCFKCVQCNRTLRLGNYASLDGQIYCKPHFISLFKQKGNYEEGFGKERHKNKWLDKENTTPVAPSDRKSSFASDRKPSLGSEKLASQPDIIKSTIASDVFHAPPSRVGKSDTQMMPPPAEVPLRSRFQRGSSSDIDSEVARRSRLQRGSRSEDRSSRERSISSTSEDEGHVKKRESFHFKGMASVKSMWETGSVAKHDIHHTNAEIINTVTPKGLKSRYEAALKESASRPTARVKPIEIQRASPGPISPINKDEVEGREFNYDDKVTTAPKPGNMKNLLAKWATIQTPASQVAKEKHSITPPREQSPERSPPHARDPELEETEAVPPSVRLYDEPAPSLPARNTRDRFDRDMYQSNSTPKEDYEQTKAYTANSEEEDNENRYFYKENNQIENGHIVDEEDDAGIADQNDIAYDPHDTARPNQPDDLDQDESDLIPSPIKASDEDVALNNNVIGDDTLDDMAEKNAQYNETLLTTQLVTDVNQPTLNASHDLLSGVSEDENEMEYERLGKSSENKYSGLNYGSDMTDQGRYEKHTNHYEDAADYEEFEKSHYSDSD